MMQVQRREKDLQKREKKLMHQTNNYRQQQKLQQHEQIGGGTTTTKLEEHLAVRKRVMKSLGEKLRLIFYCFFLLVDSNLIVYLSLIYVVDFFASYFF